MLCISWIIKCLIIIDARCKHEEGRIVFTARYEPNMEVQFSLTFISTCFKEQNTGNYCHLFYRTQVFCTNGTHKSSLFIVLTCSSRKRNTVLRLSLMTVDFLPNSTKSIKSLVSKFSFETPQREADLLDFPAHFRSARC